MLKRVTDNVWSHEKEIRLPGAMVMPCRATVVRLADGGLVVHSPLEIDDATASELDAIGEVRFLVAPNRLHWMFLKAAHERYSRARVFGAPGLERKVGILFEPLSASGRLAGVGDELWVERIEGAPWITEHALFHERSRSLIVSDLFFNVRRPNGFMTNLFFRIVGAHRKTAQSRVWRLLVKDRTAAARSAEAVLGWDFERVIVGHGDIVEEDARERARAALAWMTEPSSPKCLVQK